MPQKIKTAIIPVAGLGTRSLPFSKCVPKEMLPVLDTPTIQFIVQECVDAGIDRVVLISSRDKVAIEDHFDLNPGLDIWLRSRGKVDLADRMQGLARACEIITVRQKEPLGLGHAILCAAPVIGDQPFVVCLGDEIFPPWTEQKPALKTLLDAQTGHNQSVVGVVEIARSESPFYGIVDIGGEKLGEKPVKIRAAVEKPEPAKAPSGWAIIGRYVFSPSILEELKRVRPGVGGEIQLTDAMNGLAHSGALFACKIEGPRYDMGNPYYFVKAQIDAALRRPELAGQLREYLVKLCR